MRKSIKAASVRPEAIENLGEISLSLEELIRRGARQIIQQAIEVEVDVLTSSYAHVTTTSGQQVIVRNGYLPERNILTAAGPVAVKVPKVRDRSKSGIKFNSQLVPPYVRKTPRIAAALPWLYLKGISTGDMSEALQALLGDEAKGLSAPVVSRLKAQWADDWKIWNQRDLSAERYVYWWVDGVYTGLRADETDKQCLLVIIGVKQDGSKERVAIGDGLRESKESWRDLLLDLKERGLPTGPLLATGDGAMGFWAALNEVYPETRHQRCWVHKTANVLNALPKSLQGKAKADIRDIWMAPTLEVAERAFKRFVTSYGAKYPQAVEKLTKDEDALLAFYDFPAEHWQHIRTTNPIESTFATVRHRSARTRNCVSRTTFLGLAFKLMEEAEKSWNKIHGADKITALMQGVVFKNGDAVKDNLPLVEQKLAA
jgi:transposase-like protein